jgi:putative ribosome biogenesis GTPase RsgA
MQKTYPKNKAYVIIPFGSAGAGKSTLCNFLIDGEDSQRCKTSKTTDGGETTKVSHHEGIALGDSEGKKIKVFDVPGMADP